MQTATPVIALPDYKTTPPYGGSPLAWFGFFLRPHTPGLITFFSLNLVRQSIFKSMAFFLGVFTGLASSGADIKTFAFWVGLYALLNFIAFAMLIIIIPAGRMIDTISKQVSLFGFTHYLSLPEAWHESRASGEKLQRLLTARQATFDLLENLFWHAVAITGTAVAVILAVTVLKAPLHFILLFYLMIAAYVGLSHITVKWMKKRFADYNLSLEKLIGGVYEFLVSTATVRFFNLRRHVLQKAAELETVNHDRRMQLYKIIFVRWFLMDCTAMFWILTIIGLATYNVMQDTISLAAYAAVISLTMSIWYELENFAIVYAKLTEQWEGFKRLIEVLNNRPTIKDKPDAKNLKPVLAPIHFENLTFGYYVDRNIIQDFNLDIKPGEKIGLLGPSGAGKSTIVKLLMRFYDVGIGAVTINGQDIRNITQHSLQDLIAVIPQDAVLFNHPLMENIRYGRLDATDDEVMEAARRAHADEFIHKLPHGYQTVVGERGVKLSGGQRQRIAIARAILKNAPVLVLDEATSSLDSESEKMIQDSLYELMEGKTVIAIAHRLSTIAHLDRLIVMDEGRIVEQGSHNELLQKGGLYARLWSLQSGGFLGE